MKNIHTLVALVSLAALVSFSHQAVGRDLLIQSTTSTANSGLYDYLLPTFEKQTGITVRVVAVGTGQAIRNAKNCDGDVLLVHAKSSEQAFVEAGYGVERHDLMYNDFVIVGPPSDPANITGTSDIRSALQSIRDTKAPFVSRGDDSGTHKKERSLWQSANIDPTSASGSWYRESGSGMGATLNIAVGMNAYTMTDRATWISFKNKQKFDVVVEGDTAMFNQYGIILVDKTQCPNTDSANGARFVNWLLSKQGQQKIEAYKVAGQQLFFPNAR